MNITQAVIAERDRALLGGDFDTYHTQTTRRIHALRKRLGVTTPRGKKYTPKAPVTGTEIGQNAEWIHLLLANAERAWAEAMSMKSKQSPENTQKPLAGSTKRQIISRLRKAISYATNLVTALSERPSTKASGTDLLEAKAYLALLKGGLDFERNRWASCIRNYSFSRVVYAALGSSTKSDIYKDLLSNTVDPSIRYAAYQEKLPRTQAVQDISIERFPSEEADSKRDISSLDSHAFETTADKVTAQSEGAKDIPTSIEWRGRKVRLEDASISQALGLAMMRQKVLSESYQSFLDRTTTIKDLAAGYDDVITARQDAADACKETIDELIAQGVDQSDTRIQSLQITRTAVSYGVIEWRIGRNRVLCGTDDGMTFEKKERPLKGGSKKQEVSNTTKAASTGRQLATLRERVALYDSILQNLDAVKQLPGVMADTEFVQEVDAKYAYFRALKCLAIGRSYSLHGQTHNALALYAQANDLATKSASLLKKSSDQETPPKLQVSAAELQTLQRQLNSYVIQYQALSELHSLNESKTSGKGIYSPPLLERLHTGQYVDDVDLKNIVNYPPKLRTIPLQPLFFDLAWNYIQYPGKENVALSEPPRSGTPSSSAPEKKDEQPKKKGWFGFGRS